MTTPDLEPRTEMSLPRPRLRPLALALIALGVGLASALGAVTRPIRFDRLSLDQGLSQSTVLAIFQDREGYIWLGTEDGLNRYDGHRFTHYQRRRAEPGTLVSDFVYAISADASGDLWIATEGGGLAHWRRALDRFDVFRHDPADSGSLASDAVRTVLVASDGAVWVGTKGAGLDRYDPASGRFTHFRHRPGDPSSLAHDEVFALVEDTEGKLWVGGNGGLDLHDPAVGGFRHHRHDPADPGSLADDRVRSLHLDRSGTLWIGTDGGGLDRLDRGSDRFVHHRHDPADPTSLGHDTVRAVLEDDSRRLWVGTVTGLHLFDRERGIFHRYTHDPADLHSLSDGEVMHLYQDRGGVLWVGTRSGGVSKWNPRTWAFGHHAPDPDNRDGLSHHLVTSFAEDRAGRLWVGTLGGGVNVVNRVSGRVDHYRTGSSRSAAGLADDRVTALLHDHSGAMWLGTMGGGLHRFDPSSDRFDLFRHRPGEPSSLGSDAIMSLFEDRSGTVWIGTYGGGVSRFDRRTETFRRFSHEPSTPSSLSSSRATCFAEDEAGGIWVGTEGGGLNLIDPVSGRARRFLHDPANPSSIGSDTIYSLHAAPDGTLWIGSRAGLDRTEGSARSPDQIRFSRFSTDEGLLDSDIYGIESDTQGQLWLSTNRGLLRLDPRTGSLQRFTANHGLQAQEFNFGAHYASSSGELFFGGINGFNAFHPGRLAANRTPPPVVLTSFLKSNQPVEVVGLTSGLDRVELGYRDDVVTFEFAALDFAAPGQNLYAYKLEGFDSDWIELGSVHRVTYTDLDQGDYVLRVRAANSDGVWNEEGVSLNVRVRPAPWETWWAYTAYALAATLALATFARRQHQKLAREAEYSRRLEKEVRSRTVELEDRNSELKALNRQLLEASLTDSLTGLRNRRFLFEQVSKDIALVRRRYYELTSGADGTPVNDLVFTMVDLDHFKAINDSCGHAAGDRVLVQVRDVLLQVCRGSDIVIRWGGDEFLIIGRDSDADRAGRLAERIREAIERRVFHLSDGQMVRTTCSIGFACFPFVRSHPDLLAWEQIVTLADSALYIAKQTRNAWVGYLSTDRSLDEEDLFRSIREEPEAMESRGLLDVRRSETARVFDRLRAS